MKIIILTIILFGLLQAQSLKDKNYGSHKEARAEASIYYSHKFRYYLDSSLVIS